MNTDYLCEYVELAKHLSFTETSRILNMSQPTLSKHINQLEKDLRIELFERVGNSLRLTEAGTALLPFAYQIIDAQNEFVKRAAKLRISPPPRLTISGLTDEGPSTEVLGFLVSLLSEKYGTNFLEVKSRFNRDPREMLDAKEVDIVFDPAPKEEALNRDYIGTLHIASLRLVAIVSKENPLSQKQAVSLQELKDEVFLKYEGIYLSRSWSYTENLCLNHGFVPRTKSCHCASIAELFSICVNLKSSILIVGCNFGSRIPAGIKEFCTALPIIDEEAAIPLHFLFRNDNRNPVLKEALRLIETMPCPPLHFS